MHNNTSLLFVENSVPFVVKTQWRSSRKTFLHFAVNNNLHSPEHQNTKSPYICIMDIQTILVFLLFAVALVYVGRLVFKSLQVKKDGCGGNCKCGVDFSDIKPVKK
jgi:FeoB-associated Cys-rich membrane protein